MGNIFGFDVQIRQFLAQHELGGDAGHGNIAHLGDQGNRPGCPGVGLNDIDRVVGNGILYIHQPHHVQLNGDSSGIFLDGIQVLGRNADGRYHTGGIPRMDAGQLDMFHDRRNIGVRAVADGVGLGLDGVFQELIDEDGSFRTHVNGGGHIMLEHPLIVNHFHTTAPQHVGRPDHEGIADPSCNFKGLFQGTGHARLGLWNAQLAHHVPEPVAIFGKIDGFRGRSDNCNPRFGQFAGNVQRRLSAELNNHPFRLFFFIDAEHIFNSQRLKVEFVRGIVVRGYGFRIAVDHDGFEALIL